MRLSQKKTTIIVWKDNLYIFNDIGAYELSHDKWSSLAVLVPEGTWILIDCDINGVTPTHPVLVGKPGLFSIQSSSQNPIRYKSWVKEKDAPVLYMDPWTWSEIVIGYVHTMLGVYDQLIYIWT